MKARWLFVVLVGLAGCEREPEWPGASLRARDAGWHFTWVQGGPRTYYGFGTPPTMAFSGICDTLPVFALFGGDYAYGIKRFEVKIDGKVRRFDAFEGNHGRGLFLDAPLEPREPGIREMQAIADELANARSPIIVTTDDGWSRTIPPSPMIARFVSECRSWRERVGNG